jgi:flagellar motor switch protein FliN
MTESDRNDLITGVEASVVELFDTMLSMKIEPVEASDIDALSDDASRIVGLVSLTGKVQGSVDIQVSGEMAKIMAAGMLGMEPEEIEGEDEIRDVIREICNIIGGNLKSNFSDMGLTCHISTPSLTTGKKFQVEFLNMERFERFAFAYGDFVFAVEVGVRFEVEDESDLESVLKIKKVDITKFQRLDIISSVGDSIIELFDTMLGMEVELSDREPFATYEDFRIMGQISFAGNIKGSIALQVPKTFGRMMTAAVLGSDYESVTEMESVQDAIGELTNILAGNLKAAFCDSGLTCQISPPSITVGLDFQIEILNMDRYERFAFRMNDHDILVEVCVKIEEDAAAEAVLSPSNQPGADADDSAATLTDDQIQEMLASAKAAKDEATPSPVDTDTREAASKTTAAPKPPDAGTQATTVPGNLDFIMDIPVDVVVELGRTRIAIKDLLKLKQGAAVVLSNLEGEPVDVIANQRLIARGEVLVEREKYGIRITEVVSSVERIRSLMP